MKKSLLSLALALLTIALATGSAYAVAGPNSIGVYFDTGAASNHSTASPYANLVFYLIATGTTEASGISGWEAHIYFDPTPGAGVTYTLLGNNPLNVLSAPDFQVGIGGAPFAQATAIPLMSMQTFYLGGALKIGVGPITSKTPSRPYGDTAPYDTPCMAAGAHPEILYRLWPSSNITQVVIDSTPVSYAYWVASVNDPQIVPVEDMTWGAVKSLYE